MATGAADANGIWIYGEDDNESTHSALLNKLGNSVSTTVTRLEEMSGLTPTQRATHQINVGVGLVPIDVPTVVATGGSASEAGNGRITFTTCTDIRLQDVFSSTYRNYRIFLDINAQSATGQAQARIMSGTTPRTASYNVAGDYRDAPGTNGNLGGENIGEVILSDVFAGSPARCSVVLDVMHPQLSGKNTVLVSFAQGVRSDGAMRTYRVIGEYPTAEADTGILFRAATGNISGTIQAFGYNI